VTQASWKIRLGEEAEKDFAQILKYTHDTFGARQVAAYRATLIDALAELASGPDALGSVARDEILPNLRKLHVARRGRHGRHFILYRAASGSIIEVIRILHDRMDLARHVPTNLE
jgi:toxin ParE1/3/4